MAADIHPSKAGSLSLFQLFVGSSFLAFYFGFGLHTHSAQDLLLALQSGIIPWCFGRPEGTTGMEPRLDPYKAYALLTVLRPTPLLPNGCLRPHSQGLSHPALTLLFPLNHQTCRQWGAWHTQPSIPRVGVLFPFQLSQLQEQSGDVGNSEFSLTFLFSMLGLGSYRWVYLFVVLVF